MGLKNLLFFQKSASTFTLPKPSSIVGEKLIQKIRVPTIVINIAKAVGTTAEITFLFMKTTNK